MKKKMFFMIVAVFLLLTAVQVTILANDAIAPRHNVATTTTNISIFESGRSIINVRYMGYPDVTQGAAITLRIEKKNLFSWHEVISQTYMTNEAHHMNKFEYPLAEMGTYRFTVIYVISGSAGEDDVIKVCEEKIYDENCPEFPPIYHEEDFSHDCTSADCCEYCYKIIGAAPFSSHTDFGTWKVYDNEYHYSDCKNYTVSSAKCLEMIKEAHQYGENGICGGCGYKALTFTEALDEDDQRVSITLFADDRIWSRLNTEWLDSDAYKIIEYQYIRGGWEYDDSFVNYYTIVERQYTGSYTQYRVFEGTYTIHIPLESYKDCREKGIKLFLSSQEKTFSVIIYPSLELG